MRLGKRKADKIAHKRFTQPKDEQQVHGLEAKEAYIFVQLDVFTGQLLELYTRVGKSHKHTHTREHQHKCTHADTHTHTAS